MAEKYKIEVSDECVEIMGTLTIREAFDFLNFFEREGYTTLEDWGERTTLYLSKRNLDQELIDKLDKERFEDLKFTQARLEESQNTIKDLEQRIKDLEYLIKKIGYEGTEMHQRLKQANESLQKFKSLQKLKESPEAAKIMAMDGPGQELEDLTQFSEGTVE